MNIKTEFLENFKRKYKPGVKKSELWKYVDEIKELLELGYGYKQIYIYLRDYRQIKFKEHSVYMFIRRNKDKILNIEQPVKEEEPKPQEQKTHQNKPTTKEPGQKQEQKIKTTPTTPADRKKDFKRYLQHWDKQPENYLQYTEDKLNEKEFNTVLNKLIDEKLITSFEFIEDEFKEPYQPKYICGYLRACKEKLKDKDDFKAFTPAMYKHYMVDNFFAKSPSEQL